MLTDITIQSVAQSSAVTQGLVGWSLTALSAQKNYIVPLSHRESAMPRVTEYFAKSLKIT